MTRNKAVAKYLEENHGLLLGERTLEDLWLATVEHARKTIRVRGRSMATGRKKWVTLPLIVLSAEIRPAKEK